MGAHADHETNWTGEAATRKVGFTSLSRHWPADGATEGQAGTGPGPGRGRAGTGPGLGRAAEAEMRLGWLVGAAYDAS